MIVDGKNESFFIKLKQAYITNKAVEILNRCCLSNLLITTFNRGWIGQKSK